ncbi:MAG: phosphoribosylaminoimidazolesuccinocarboxamide synthase [Deltaproteobacteria bacterium]|nr:phosphoribosylaminoimidazolesuccinocarboxamide synthase [Deltaproteobacteria bacterium]
MSSLRDTLSAQLPHTLGATHLDGLGARYAGKVRDTYRAGDRLVLVSTDRLSAFDRVLTTVPFKGELLNRLSAAWFRRTAHVVPNHLLDVPDPSVLVARACEPLRVEVVVRGRLTGSLWRAYAQGGLLPHGLSLPPGMARHQAFPAPLLTPTTKDTTGGHDAPLSEAEVVSSGLASARDWAAVREAALALFAAGQAWSAQNGLLLVDTKYEFGKAGGQLLVMDEIHTPDSSRFWELDGLEERLAAGQEPRMLDKETVRQWLVKEAGFSGDGPTPIIPDTVRVAAAETYCGAFARLAGEPLGLQVGPALPRLEANLRAAGLLR